MKKNLNITNPHYSEHIQVCDFHFGPALHGKFTQFQSYTVCNNKGCQAALNGNGLTINFVTATYLHFAVRLGR